MNTVCKYELHVKSINKAYIHHVICSLWLSGGEFVRELFWLDSSSVFSEWDMFTCFPLENVTVEYLSTGGIYFL